MTRFKTHRSVIERAVTALIDALEANPWLLPAGVGVLVLIANYPWSTP